MRQHKKKGGIENIDYVVCAMCGCIKYGSFVSHVAIHDMDINTYRTMYPTATDIPSVVRERVMGEKNPSYQHGGANSPWSHNSKFHTTAQIENSRKKAKENFTSPRAKEFWLKQGLTEDEATRAVQQFQTRDKNFFIAKYGQEEGLRRWKNKVDQWQATLDAKPLEEKERINKAKLKGTIRSISSGEQKLASMIRERLPDPSELKTSVFHKKPDQEGTHFVFDMVYKGKKIIEYNGDYWHANPKKYSDTDLVPLRGKGKTPAQHVWNKDHHKYQIARAAGYEVMVVWESDFKNNPQTTLESCLSYLTT
jgi:hypothetical protein